MLYMKVSVGSTVGENLKGSSNPPPESWNGDTREWCDCDLGGRENKQWLQAWALRWHLQDQMDCKLDGSGAASRMGNYSQNSLEGVAAGFYLFNDGWWVFPGTLKRSACFNYLWCKGSGKNRPLQEDVNCHLARRRSSGKNSARPLRSPQTPLRMAKVYFRQDHYVQHSMPSYFLKSQILK